jgi:hypothetical protein
MAFGVVAAHWVAYLVAVPDAGSRRALLAASGHAYVAWVPMAIGALGSFAVLLLSALIVGASTSLGRVRLRPGAFLALPPLAFALQEHAERLRVGYASPWHVWQEPTFWRGLLLQLPFGLLAYGVARLLLRASRAVQVLVGRRRGGAPRPVRWPAAPRLHRFPSLILLVPVPVRGGDALAFRGPPACARGSL